MEFIRLRVFYKGKMVPCELTMDDYIHVYNEEKQDFEIAGCVGKGRILKERRVMQFVGMFDKNKKMIYEGDIVKMKLRDDEYVQGEIIFKDASFVLETNNFYHLTSSENLEVLSNVYVEGIRKDEESE